MSDAITSKTAAELAEAIRTGEHTSREVTQAFLDRIDARDEMIGAFLHVDHDGALATADEVDRARQAGEELGPLAGVPIAVKDLYCTIDMPTTAASKMLEGWVPPYDSTIVERIRAAKMPILGKTNMDEFAMGSSTEYSAFQLTRNPWDTNRIPGGSGGGSSAAVAGRLAPLATGTDTGGSIRQPGAVTGTFGAKPTYGGTSRYGLIAFSSSLDTPGPVSRTALDSALLHEVMAGHDPRDSTSINQPVPPVVEAARSGASGDLSGVTLGVVKEFASGATQGAEEGVIAAYRSGVAALEKLGAKIVEVSCPNFVHALPTYYLIAPSECSSNLARYDGVRYGLRTGDDGQRSLEEVMSATREDGFGPEVKRRIMLGTYALSAGYVDQFYGQAQKVRTLITQDFQAAFEQVDALISPTTPFIAFEFGARTSDPYQMYLADLYTIPSNLYGGPAVSVPCGLSEDMPAGLQVMGPTMGDDITYRVAAALESAQEPLLADTTPELDERKLRAMTDVIETVDYADVVARYEPVIGLETHVELGTNTKMFCGCATEFGAEPNTQVCPVCLGLPGALPVANRAAIEATIRIGLMLNCSIASWCRFARKNYFYPDMPKNFQTSQYDEPLCENGWVDVVVEGETHRVEIERVHLEEDTGKTLHVGGATGRIHGATESLVDYNRAGIPLVEIVTKPVAGAGEKAPEIARAYVTELRDILRSLNVSDVRMEQGSMRCDVNTSISKPGEEWGTRSETKNVNSLRSVERAVRFEMTRQAAVLDGGGAVVQETRHFQEDSGSTAPGRSKETATDYRYFPEPDLAPMEPDPAWVKELQAALPELPRLNRQRLQETWGLTDFEMQSVVNAEAVDLIEATVEAGATSEAARKWWLGELSRTANEQDVALEDLRISPPQVAALQEMVDAGKLNDKLARQVIVGVLAGEGDPAEVASQRGLEVVSDTGALDKAVDDAIEANPDVAEKIRGGKQAAAGALIGSVMKATRGQADAKAVRELILQKLS